MSGKALKRKTGVKNLDRFREAGMAVAIALLCILVQSRNSNFFTSENISDLFTNTAILSILSVGMMMVIISRGIDLSIGSTLAISGMVVTKLMIVYPGMPIFAAFLLGILIGAVCGGVIGALIAYGKLPPIIASLGMMNAYRGIAFLISEGVWVSAHQMTDGFKRIATGSLLGVNNLIVIAVLINVAAYLFLTFSAAGRRIYAVGNNAEAALISGIKSQRVLFMIYTIMGALAGLAGILWVSKYASAQGNTAAGYEMNVIAACVLGGVSVYGGVGKISGLVLGILFYGTLTNSLPMLNVSPFVQQAIQALLILGAILLNVMIKRRMQANNRRRRNI